MLHSVQSIRNFASVCYRLLLTEFSELASNSKCFRRAWTNYKLASSLVKQLKEERTSTLLARSGPDALEIVDGLSFESEKERKDIDAVLGKLEALL